MIAWAALWACRRDPTDTRPVPEPPAVAPPGTGTVDSGAANEPSGWGSCGTLRSLVALPSPREDDVVDVAADDDGGRVLTGWNDGPLTLGTGTSAASLVPAGEIQRFVARYTGDGRLAWALPMDGSTRSRLYAAVPAGSGVVAAGTVDGLGAIGGLPVGETGGLDAVLVWIDADGAVGRLQVFGSDGDDAAAAVAALPDGGIVVGGWFGGAAALGTSKEDELTPLSSGTYSGFLARYTSGGDLVWAERIAGAEYAVVQGLAYDSAADTIAVVGSAGTSGAVLGTGGSALRVTGSGSFLARYGADGGVRWAESLGTVAVAAVSVFPDGGIAVGGTLFEDATFAGEQTLELQGYADAFVARYDPDGRFAWAARAAAATDDALVFGEGVTVLPDGRSVLTATFYGAVALDDAVLTTGYNSEGLTAVFDAEGRADCWLRAGGPRGTVSRVAMGPARTRPDGLVDVVGRVDGTVRLGEGTPQAVDLEAADDNAFVVTVEL